MRVYPKKRRRNELDKGKEVLICTVYLFCWHLPVYFVSQWNGAYCDFVFQTKLSCAEISRFVRGELPSEVPTIRHGIYFSYSFATVYSIFFSPCHFPLPLNRRCCVTAGLLHWICQGGWRWGNETGQPGREDADEPLSCVFPFGGVWQPGCSAAFPFSPH